jgi:hypothetical protein
MNDQERAVMQKALEALEKLKDTTHSDTLYAQFEVAITALRAALAQQEQEQEPVAWTDRELQLIDGMIEVQLHHAAQCDGIANRTMAEKQKGWDMERVALLQKIKSNPPRREPELLKALKLIRQSIVNPLSVQMSQQQLSECVRAAIAKAEGQA